MARRQYTRRDRFKDFTTTFLSGRFAMYMARPPGGPVKSIAGFVQFARSKPGIMNYAGVNGVYSLGRTDRLFWPAPPPAALAQA